ncbi:valine--tRNA ligase [Parvibaculum sedimenti]|uniref:Valine--tRNA ligase n=3 Tax=Parvibaculum sedimenti TaxID=2608632 RepID=A0A6N6VG15_9HYPH|nr:valine--tRNA ligase [Parvibaculum sedimenti]KAB7739620.1 valine--tRNA ligase [Parvibaculum sedimenti]
MLEKTFSPKDVEERLYRQWEESGAFKAGNPERVAAGAKPYSIVIPPPNVTGSLHMGHALNNTLQDVLIRFERMRGKDVLWQPGLDHAGIATQMIVERQLEGEGNVRRRDMGREAFIERVWKWKGESGGSIINQLRRLGASCDWSRERFTLGERGAPDEQMVRAVTKVFVELHAQGLIYRDKRLVNWDPKLQTAVSDLEVENIEVKGNFWHFRYPLADGKTVRYPSEFDEEGKPTAWEDRPYIVVATTRPETMLGDTAVAVNAEDERYKHLKGAHVILPLVGRKIPIVFDEHADPTQGSGAVKITPAHDFNDFEVGKRHGLPQINILTADGKINDEAPEAYRGLDRFDARKKIVADIEALELLDRIEPKTVMVPHDEKSKMTVIEPYLTDQWYVDAATLAKPAIAAVERGETTFVPKNWEKTYFEWMRNIQPWCISRQLWWGHRIPAWYAEDGEIFVAHSEDEAYAAAEKHYGKRVELKRDEDVLDTWFSSALWPFSTLGWPDETPELKRYYKTDVLVTGFDIIFFWVARMMMMGLHFMNEVPFRDVYIHALVRDEKGQKMSKTKGNVIDPLKLIDEYGADALRFTLAAMAAQGRDIKLATNRVEGYRNFGTKLWNAARFCEMNECARVEGFDPAKVTQTVNQWIVGEVARTAAKVTEEIEGYRYNEAAGAIYRFVWNVFCDWYLEFIKPLLLGTDESAKAETRATAAWVLDQILLILHPFMPFMTEELWATTAGPARKSLLVMAEWPNLSGLRHADADAEMGWVIRLISDVRSVRAEMNVPAGAKIPLLIKGASQENLQRLARHKDLILRLARLASADTTDAVPAGSLQLVLDEATVLLPIADFVDLKAETARLAKEIGKLESEIEKLTAKLANEKFVASAPEHVVEEQRERKADAEAARTKFKDALKMLEGAV